jgi:hypothetical protein
MNSRFSMELSLKQINIAKLRNEVNVETATPVTKIVCGIIS